MQQRDPKLFLWMDKPPTEEDITKSIAKIGNEKSAGYLECPAEYYKALETDEEAKCYIRDIITEFWISDSYMEPIQPEPSPASAPRRLSISQGLNPEAMIAIANKPLTKPKKPAQVPDPIPENFVLPTKDQDADQGGVVYDELLVARLILLPKKGDLSLSKKWRGICLLDIASKIVSCVLVACLQVVQEKEDL